MPLNRRKEVSPGRLLILWQVARNVLEAVKDAAPRNVQGRRLVPAQKLGVDHVPLHVRIGAKGVEPRAGHAHGGPCGMITLNLLAWVDASEAFGDVDRIEDTLNLVQTQTCNKC